MSDYGSTPPPPPPPGGGDGGYSAPPPPAGGGFGGTPPDNKLVWSILVTIFCCLPFGIVAIIKSAEVNSKWAAGDHAGAQQSAADAGKWIKWAVIAGVIVIVLYLIFVVGLGFLSASTSP
ncbi:CD225/dispanin family protein [Phycicoccus sp.]|uniref:CD225/dispanin family protein n=1 Tax=Phycicoccus sp. TaxID=1902410 RepID=UPI002C7CFACD|nr:CD225/dispanin family protein [Phycicoccus sp.]HMM96172.1 CD225/dispanin family protein [Phycicoccus sp.]